MDSTLAQILTEVYRLTAENERLRSENANLKAVVDSQLPVHEADAATAEALGMRPAGSVLNDQKGE